MKMTASVSVLADAASLAASLAGGKEARNIPALAAARLAGGNTLEITGNNLDAELSIAIEADASGEAAVPAKRLAELLKHFDGDSEVTIATSDKVATVAAGKSKYRLPVIPLTDMPLPFALDGETGRVELEAALARDLFSRVTFAISTEKSRYYLNGLCLHDVDGGLAAVASDGHRLARLTVPATTSLSADRGLIVPDNAVKTITRLLNDADGMVTLRRSERLFEIIAGKFRLVSKLIDASYPDYERIISSTAGAARSATVDRAAFTSAISRFAAVTDPQERATWISLSWRDSEMQLSAASESEDSLAAETVGAGEVTVQIGLLADQVTALRGQRVRIAATEPIVITDPEDQAFLSLLCSMRTPKA